MIQEARLALGPERPIVEARSCSTPPNGWARSLLDIAGLKMRDILGYTTITLIVSGIVFAVTLLIVGSA